MRIRICTHTHTHTRTHTAYLLPSVAPRTDERDLGAVELVLCVADLTRLVPFIVAAALL